MNSGGAQVLQADHPALIGMKGKGKSKGTDAASLLGALFAILPGTAKEMPGFGAMLQSIRGNRSGLGAKQAHKPATAGLESLKGRSRLRSSGEVLRQQETGSTKASVLQFGEAARAPSEAPLWVEGERPGVAPKDASNQPGSSTGLPASGNNQGRILVSPAGSESGKGTPLSARGKPPRVVEASDKGRPAKPSRVETVVLVKNQASDTKGARAPGIRPEGARPKVKRPGTSPRLGLGAQDSRLVRPDGRPQVRTLYGNGESKSEVPLRGAKRPGQSRPRAGQSESSQRLTGAKGLMNGVTSPMEAKQPRTQESQFIPEMVELGQRVSGGRAGKGRVVNQGRQGSNLPLTDNRGAGAAPASTSGRALKTKAKPARPVKPDEVVVRNNGTRISSPIHKRNVEGHKVRPAHSLTNQDGLRQPAPEGAGPSRGFVKLVQVGIQPSSKPTGNEEFVPMTHSMPTPQPVPMEAAVSLASLARMTVLQYSRFVKSEQPQSVFTFDSGQLGQVRLAFSESEVGTMLHIVVESTEVRQMLQRALSNLEQEWTHQGLDFSDVNVEVGDTGQEHGFPDQGTAGRNPAISSATIEDSVADMETESVKDYGYNTVEYVA